MPPAADATAAIKRELLVRRLEGWAGTALSRARRATYLHGYADLDGGRAAAAAARALADIAGFGRGKEIVMVAIAETPLPADSGRAGGVPVLPVLGATDDRLEVALRAASATAAPVFGYLDGVAAALPPALATIAALRIGRPAEALIVLGPEVFPRLAAADPPAGLGERLFGDDRWRTAAGHPAFLVELYRGVLQEAGFPLVAAVELVAAEGEPGELVVFATTSGKSLAAFKDELWAVDEFAGVRYRDPGDPEGHLLDISLTPHPGPLRRELLAHLADAGERTVTELRTYTLTETAYRAADATRVIGALVTAGAVTRSPEHGRLGGDVVIAAV